MTAALPTTVRFLSIALFVIAGLFVASNVFLHRATLPGANTTNDTRGFMVMAEALASTGAFVDASDPGQPPLKRQPGYPVLVALALWTAGSSAVSVIVAFQVVFLFLTGVITYYVVEDWLPRYGLLGLAFVVFNPNALGNAHFLLSDTLFAFLFAGVVWAGLRFFKTFRMPYAAATGGLLALCVLVRPEPIYLLYALPLLFLLGGIVAGQARHSLRWVAAGLLALAVAAVVLAPWMTRNYMAGAGYRIVAGSLAGGFVWKNVFLLEKIANPEKGLGEIARDMNAELDQLMVGFGDDVSSRERNERLLAYSFSRMIGYGPAVVLKATIQSQVGFFGAAGAQNLHVLLGSNIQSSDAIFRQDQVPDRVVAFWKSLASGSGGALLISGASFFFVIALRVFGLLGLAGMIVRRQWVLLFVVIGVIAYISSVHLFTGLSRYRLPVEPLLILMALYGFASVRGYVLKATARAN